MDDIERRVEDLEKEIAELPIGYISKKNIRGKIKMYHQWTEQGKKKSKYLNDDTASYMTKLIEKRRSLEKELKELKKQLTKELSSAKSLSVPAEHQFKTEVLIGTALRAFVDTVRGLRHRSCYDQLNDYLNNSNSGKVFILLIVSIIMRYIRQKKLIKSN